MSTIEIAFASLGLGVQAALWFAVALRVHGLPAGPPREWGRRHVTRPPAVPPPPDPSLNRWRPWFRFWGPAWLDLRLGLATEPGFWASFEHQRTAHRFYVEDNLPETIAAAQEALAFGTRAGMWPAKLLGLATAELAARDDAVTLRRPPFVFELPAEDRRFDPLMEVADKCRATVEATLGCRSGPVMVTLLEDARLPRDSGSRWGYWAPKRHYAKVCLLHPPPDGLAEASLGLVTEYNRLSLHTLAGGNAPRWLVDGLAQWTAKEVLGSAPTVEGPPASDPPGRPTEGLLARALGYSPLARLAASGLSPLMLIERLLAHFGMVSLREFVARLETQNEGHAFRAAFGITERQFVEAWHRKAGRESDGR